MIAHNERMHIRSTYGIIEDMHELTGASITLSDCELIEDRKGTIRARERQEHRAFVLYAHIVDYIEDCGIIDKDTRQKLVTQFSDILDGFTLPDNTVDNTK